MKLRDYQIETEKQILQDLKKYNKIAVQMPTGSGKTELAMSIAQRFINGGMRVFFAVGSRNLVDQTYSRFIKNFPNCGIIMSDREKLRKRNSKISVGSIHTLMSYRKRELPVEELEKADLIFVDEAHDCSNTDSDYVKTLEKYEEGKKFIGLSATFQRLGRRGHSWWDKVQTPISGYDLMEKGYLPKLTIYAPKITYSTAGVSINSLGDYSSSQILSRLDADKNFYSDFKEEFLKYSVLNNTIIFCASVLHCEKVYKIIKSICKWGNVFIIHSGLHPTKIKRIKAEIDEIRQNPNDNFTIVNVNMLSRGVDLPELDVGIMIRPTASEVLYRQQVGRLTRGTKPVKLIDLTTNSKKFSHPYQMLQPFTEKTWTGKLDTNKMQMKTCPKCFITLEAYMFSLMESGICPICQKEMDEESKKTDVVRKNYNTGLEKLEETSDDMKRLKRYKIFEKVQKKYGLGGNWAMSKFYKEKEKDLSKSIDNFKDFKVIKKEEECPF